MKIIDNKKDYYDYMVGYYGLDDYVVYDRRNSTIVSKQLLRFNKDITIDDCNGRSEFRVTLWAGHNMLTKILCIDVDKKAGTKNITWKTYSDWCKDESRKAWFRHTIHEKEWQTMLPKRITPETPLALYITDISSWRHRDSEVIVNPILEGSIFTNILSAKEVYEGIYNYLLECKEPKIEDKRNDIEHIESHGFDKKTSFRKM